MDKKCEDVIVKILKEYNPEWGLLCEESGVTASSVNSPIRWIVDPLDGTTSFTHSHPFFSVSIALEHRTHGVLVGVVYNPTLDEMFVGKKGKGATKNGKSIHVSSTDSLINSLLATGFPTSRSNHMHDHNATNVSYFTHMLMLIRDCRRNGSAALDLCYVACGRQDGYWEQKLKAWDIAAGALILQEAGGTFTGMNGSDIEFGKVIFDERMNIVGSNGRIHEVILQNFRCVEGICLQERK